MGINKNIVIKWMLTTLWIAAGAGAVVLLVAAVRMKDAEHCKGVNITITGVQNSFFVDKKDILDSITSIEEGNPVGNPVGSFNLKMMEAKLVKNIWVKKAELFFDNNAYLQVKVTEREPVARVFTTTGTTFYIDTAIAMLPLSDKFSARLPVFTDFPSDRIVLSKADSNLLRDIRKISLAIQKDSFFMALIDQVDIAPDRTFQFVPKIGNNIIVFGDASDVDEKLSKLKLFYKKVMMKTGWSYYTVINVQYKNQVVAKRKGADDKTSDSLRTIQIMQQIAINAEKAANDSMQMIAQDNNQNTTDENIIQQSMQRDDNEDAPNTFEKLLQQQTMADKPVLPKPVVVAKPAVATVVKPKPNPTTAKKPLVVKPKINPAPVKKTVAPVIKPKPSVTKPITEKTTSYPNPVQTTKPVPKKKTFESKPNNDY
jgi:cell division protein FtsQ